MPSARTKSWAFNGLLGAVWLGIPVFVVMVFFGDWVATRDAVDQLEAAQVKLGTWVKQGNLPTRTKIDAATNYRDGLFAEYDSVESYFKRRDEMLERPLLATYQGDPRQVKIKYMELKEQLRARSRLRLADNVFRAEFMPPYRWEAPTLTPSRDEFDSLEKKACVAEALVALLCTGQPCIVGHVSVGEPIPTVPEDTIADFEGSDDTEAFLSYVIWPAEVHFMVPFAQAGAMLGRLSAPPTEYPPILIRGLEVEARDARNLVVVAHVGMLDFN
jgi:hypothetical protein